jgi:glycosyltransferase involved in cell wall biosynthesis
MRVLATTSGLSPCGIADYHNALIAGFGPGVAVSTVRMPTDFAPRSRPLRLLARRAWVSRLARQASRYDAVLVQYHPRYWNHVGRRGEDLFPVFVDAVRCPVVAIVHEPTDPIRERPPGGNRVARVFKQLNLRLFEFLNRCSPSRLPGAALAGCAAVFVHTPELRDWLVWVGVSEARVKCRPHPVFPLSPPAWSADEVDRRFGLADRRVAVVVGFPDPRKGFDLAVRALSGLPSDVVLVWAGGVRGEPDAREAFTLDQLARELGVAGRFIRTGFLAEPELSAVLLRADVGLAPFRHASGSGSVSRLLAAGMPVVATDLPPFRELRDAGGGVVLVAESDSGAWVGGVQELLRDPGNADRLRTANRRFAAGHGFAALAAEIVDRVRLRASKPAVQHIGGG